jgi:outer membrane protein assembly factor BamA
MGRLFIIGSFLLLQLLVLGKSFAQTDTDTISPKQNYFVGVPILFYGEETNWGFGATTGYYFSKEGVDRVSNIQGSAIYTLKNQVSLSFLPKLYTSTRDFYYSGHFKANYYPDKYFGIGRNTPDSLEENYTSKDLSVLFQRQRVLFNVMMIGVQAQMNFYQTEDKDINGELVKNTVIGSKNHHTTGAGLLFTWDNRDNMFYPGEGEFYKISLMVYSKIFGSDLNFTKVTLDLRNFYPIGSKHLLALQVYSDLSWGSTPFQMMPALGGNEILRGYYKGRYRDKMMVSAQAEYRFPIYKWLKGAAFVSAGDVSSAIDEFKINEFKYSFGGGLRTRVNPFNVHLRFDAGFTQDRKPAFYFTASEAF